MKVRRKKVRRGFRASTTLTTAEDKKWAKNYITKTSQDKINICLNCTKPVEECKGNCKI